VTTIASVTFDRATFWRRTALRSQEQCVQYLERIEAQDDQLRRMQDLILELNAEAVELQKAYEGRGRRIADLEEEYATAMGQVSVAHDPRHDELIEYLDLTVRAYNVLKRENIHTVGDLVKKSYADLADFRNFGAKSIDEVEAKLAERDLGLAPSPPGFEPSYFGIGAGALGVGYATVYGQRDLSIQK